MARVNLGNHVLNSLGILRAFEGVMDFAVFILDGEGSIIAWSKNAQRLFGYTDNDVLGQHFSFLHRKGGKEHGSINTLKLGRAFKGERRLFRKDGSEFLARISITPVDSIYVVVLRDISGEKELEERRKRTERAFNVLSKTSQAITQAKDEKELLESICRVIVDEGYAYSWIGYAMGNKSVKPVAKAGKNGYADTIKVTWDETESGLGPTGTAIREKKVTMARDIAGDPTFQPWKKEAAKRGFASSIALPIPYRSTVFGALNVYASEKDAFDEEEVKLLHEVANNLGYAIAMLRSKRKEERTKEVMDLLWKLVTKDLEYKSFLKELLKEIMGITESEYGFFGVLSEDEREFIVLAWSEEVMDCCKVSDFRFLVDKGFWVEAVRKRERIIVNDYESWPEKRLPEGHVPLKRFLIVPVIKNQMVYIAGVANKSEDYTEEDAEMLEFFMKNIQGMLEKKRMEEMYKTLIENTGTAMLISDDTTEIKFVNREAEKLLGLSKEEIVGRSWTEFVFKDELEKLLEYTRLRDIDPSLAPETFETKVVGKNGKIRQILLNISMIPGSKDRIASFIDITELRKTQEMLKESEERYKTLFEKSRDGIVLTDLDMKILDCNEAVLTLSGLEREDVIGKSFLELGVLSKDDLPLVMESFYKGLREDAGTLELKVNLKGESRWIEVSPTTLRKNGEPFALLNIVRDITERKKLEEKLKSSLERLKILHELDVSIIEGKSFKEISKLALNRLRTLLNFEIAGLFKYDKSRNEIVLECYDSELDFGGEQALPFMSRASVEDLKGGRISYINNLLELSRLTEFEKELIKRGMRAYLQMPLIVRDELMGVLCLAAKKPNAFDEKLQFIKEISDQLAIALHEAQLHEMRMKSLERLEKNIEEFAILVDHIRNPLAIITGTAELEIHDKRVKETIDDAASKIEDVVGRLDRGWLESEQIRNFLKRLQK